VILRVQLSRRCEAGGSGADKCTLINIACPEMCLPSTSHKISQAGCVANRNTVHFSRKNTSIFLTTMPERFKSTLGRIGRKRMHKDVPEDDEENAYCAKRSKRYGIQELASKMSNGNKEEAGESIETKHKNPQAGDENDGHVIRNLRLSTREKSKRQFPKNPVRPNELYLTVLPGFCQSSLAPAKLGFSARSGLCRRCTELDLDTVLSQPIKTRKARLITNLAPATNWMIDSCAFCSLLSSTLPPASPLLQQSSGHIPLISLSTYQAQGLDWRPLTSNILQLEQNGLDDNRLLVSEPAGIKGTIKFIRENLDVASFDRIKKWIDLCRNSHTKVCSIKEQSTVTGIKLIDCDTNIIIPGREHHYVALSYVWGHILEGSEIQRGSPHDSQIQSRTPSL
jgi:hypothetical protein